MQRFYCGLLLVGLAFFLADQSFAQMPAAAPITPPPVGVGVPTVVLPVVPDAPQPVRGVFEPAPHMVRPVEAPRLEAEAPAELEPRVRLTLKDGSSLIGQLDTKARFSLDSSFGKVLISWEKVQSLKWNHDKTKLSVTLKNDDRISGKVSDSQVQLTADWGKVELTADQIEKLEIGHLAEVQIPVHIVSPDGSSVSTVYRRKLGFRPLRPSHEGLTPANSVAPAGWTPGNAR